MTSEDDDSADRLDEHDPADPSTIPDPPSRDVVLHLLTTGLRETHEKVTSGRVRDAENEKVRQGWMRTLARLSGEYRKLLADRQLDDLAKRLDDIESERESNSNSDRFRYK